MALLKSLIQRLLDSRTTPEEAGHNAMPSLNEVSLTPSVTSKEMWGEVCTGTASSDGYIRMDFIATSPEAIGTARSFGAVVFSTPKLTGDIVSVMCPVAKGKAYDMSVRNANNITCAFVKLIGAIGGGHNLLVRRAVLCLRPSFNYLQKVSSRVKSLGFVTSRTAGATLLQFHSLLERLLHTWRRLTEFSLLLELHAQPLTSLFKVLPCESTWRDQINKSLLDTSHCRKDSRLTSLFSETISKTTQQDSYQQSAPANLQTGGASC